MEWYAFWNCTGNKMSSWEFLFWKVYIYIYYFLLFFYIYFFHHDGQWEAAPKDFFFEKWDHSFFTGFQVFSIVGFNVGHYAPSQKVETPYGRLVFLWEHRLAIFEFYLTLLGQKMCHSKGDRIQKCEGIVVFRNFWLWLIISDSWSLFRLHC